MLNISELHYATLLLDIAAVCIIIGVIHYTTIYRRRGTLDDKMYFQMLIITIICAVSDGITYVIDGSGIPGMSVLSVICNDIFFITFELMLAILAIYLDHHVHMDDAVTKKRARLFLIPAVIEIVLILANTFSHFLFWVDPVTTEYYSGSLYILVFVAPVVYCALGLISIARINMATIWMFALLVAVRVFLGNILSDVSSTALLFAITLVFIHIHQMRLPFYEED